MSYLHMQSCAVPSNTFWDHVPDPEYPKHADALEPIMFSQPIPCKILRTVLLRPLTRSVARVVCCMLLDLPIVCQEASLALRCCHVSRVV